MSTRQTVVRSTLALSALALLSAAGGCSVGADVEDGLTPELMTLSERPVDVGNTAKITFNENWRMYHSDWQRFWLLDRPSRLTPESVPR